MTREELKAHCEKQIKECKMWAKHNGEEPSGKVYEEHKLILELLEQEPVLNKIRAEIIQIANQEKFYDEKWALGLRHAVSIIDKYKGSENEE